MYKVLCDNALMCDSIIEELALLNPVVKLEENKAGSFSFKIPPEHPFYDVIQKRKSIVEAYQDDELIFSGMCIEASNDFYNQKDIYCEGELTYFNDSVQRPARYQDVTVRGLLEAFVNNHNAQVEEIKHFQVGAVTVKDPNDSLYCYTNMESTMTCLKKDLVDDLGGFFRIRHENGVKYLDYLAESPNTNSQVIRLGENLIDFTSNLDTSEIATAIIPLGTTLEESTVEGLETRLTIESVNDGLDYVHSAEAVSTYGWIYQTVEWDDVTEPSELKAKGEKYLAETQFENMVIEANAVDLHLTDKAVERFKLSDQIRVVSVSHGLNKYFRLTKQTLNLNNPEKDTITLGKDERLSLSAKTNQASEEIKKAMKSIVPPSTLLKRAIDNATALITSAMGGYVVKTNNELLIMDTDSTETATKVWRWNINGLGYSSNGYKGPYALAMTMDGRFVADAITVEGLEVGKNVKMGEDATIKWSQVDDANNQVTQITKDTVTSSFVNALKVTADKLAVNDANGNVLFLADNNTKKVAINTDTFNLSANNLRISSDGYVETGASNGSKAMLMSGGLRLYEGTKRTGSIFTYDDELWILGGDTDFNTGDYENQINLAATAINIIGALQVSGNPGITANVTIPNVNIMQTQVVTGVQTAQATFLTGYLNTGTVQIPQYQTITYVSGVSTANISTVSAIDKYLSFSNGVLISST